MALFTKNRKQQILDLSIDLIHPNPYQPRKHFSQEELESLAHSIAQVGILQPLVVRRTSEGWELIAGERRLRAAIQAGLTEVPCLVMQMTDEEAATAALVENLQRQDLDFVEQAQGIDSLVRQWNLSQEQVAKRLGMSQSGIANKLRLLRHSPQVLEALRAAELTERHARALLKLPTEAQKMQAIRVIYSSKMSVAKTEQYISTLLREREAELPKASVGAFLSYLTQSLARIQSAGISAVSERRETDSQIVLTITIPK